jgi:DNA-binding NarL/FixJ family response regulator
VDLRNGRITNASGGINVPYQRDSATDGEHLLIRASILRDLTDALGELTRDATPPAAPPPSGGGGTGCDHDAGIREFHGFPAINEAIAAAVNAARSEILTAQPYGPRPPEVLAAALEVVDDKIARGISMRTLYLHTTRFDEATKAYVRAVTSHGAEVRTLTEFFDRLIVIDRATAFIAAGADRSTAVRVTHPAVVNFLVDVFDRTWDRAELFPFIPSQASKAAVEVIPEIHQSIQRLLVEGHSDSAISRRLGIGARSLQAHIARIKQDLGAKNRLHLGYLLGQADAAADAERISADGDGMQADVRLYTKDAFAVDRILAVARMTGRPTADEQRQRSG